MPPAPRLPRPELAEQRPWFGPPGFPLPRARPMAWNPIVACRSGDLLGFEAVEPQPARSHRDYPSFPLQPAETCFLSAALAAAARWPDGRLLVALSPAWFAGPGLVATVAGLLERTGLDAAALLLAIPEPAVERAPAVVAQDVERLRALGVLVVLDQFGTGQAGLNPIAAIPFGGLRFAPSLVQRLGACRHAEAVARATLRMAAALGLRVAASGIDQPHQLAFLQAHGCDEVQGPLIAPLSPDLPDLLALYDRLDRSHLFFAQA